MRWWIALAAAATGLSLASAEARPFQAHWKSPLLDVEYGWSAEANAVPALVKRFRADLDKQRSSLLATARADAAERKKHGYPFNQYSLVKKVMTAGQTPRLLSLRIDSYEYTGGAHGMSGTRGLLWDRRSNRQVAFKALFRNAPAFLAALRGPYCRALDLERAKRRKGEKLGGDFDQCPAFADLGFVPADSNGNGRFDKLLVIAGPYVAGPYAEGQYEIGLPMNSARAAMVRREYRASFEVQRQ